MRQQARAYDGKRPHAGLAWLAAVALLINALVPAAISAASASGAWIADNSAFCGAVSGGTGPAKQSIPAAHRCICCLAGAVGGFLPAPPSAPLPREHAPAVVQKFCTDAATATRIAYGAARPRGPPVTG